MARRRVRCGLTLLMLVCEEKSREKRGEGGCERWVRLFKPLTRGNPLESHPLPTISPPHTVRVEANTLPAPAILYTSPVIISITTSTSSHVVIPTG